MMLLVDSGSSRLHTAWWNGAEIMQPVVADYPAEPDELPGLMHSLMGERTPERVAACSVNARWRARLFGLLERVAPGGFHVARTAGELDIAVCYRDSRTMGIDRVLAGYAAWRRSGEPCVVVDAGTAITVDAVGDGGAMRGGYIIPGFSLMAGALAAHTGLPRIADAGAAETPGDSTETCILNGIAVTVRAAVERLTGLAAAHAGASRFIVTGGDGETLRANLPLTTEYRPWLVLEGLGYAVDAGIVPLYRPAGDGT